MEDFMFGLILGLAIGLIGTVAINNLVWEKEIIYRGYGEYCSTTGDWSFKGECDER